MPASFMPRFPPGFTPPRTAGFMPPGAATRPPGPPNPALLPQPPAQPPAMPPPQQAQIGTPFDGMSEEEIAQLMGLSIAPEQMAGLNEQLAQAQALRDAPGPEGRRAGRTYVAANPLEHIGSGIQKYAAHRDIQGLRKQRDEELQKQADARTLYAKRVVGMPQSEAAPSRPPPRSSGMRY